MSIPRIHRGRFTGAIDGEVVIFLIGARFHKPWKLRKVIPIARAMRAMQAELRANSELGCLHIENYGAMRNISVQYWRSFEDLERYARAADALHLPAWRAFNRAINNSGDVGIWHETYRVAPGAMESVYGNMPRVGLAIAGDLVAAGKESTAVRRVGLRPDDQAPVEAY